MQSIDISATVAYAQAGNPGAVADLYNLYADALCRYCYLYLGDRAAAEDCVQEVFVRLWKGLRTFEYRGEQSFIGWLYTITKRVLISYRRKEQRIDYVFLTPELPVPQLLDGMRSVCDHLTLRDAIRLLPDKHRQVIMLKFFVGLSNLEIAGVLGCSEGAVKVRQTRALAKLQQLLPDNQA